MTPAIAIFAVTGISLVLFMVAKMLEARYKRNFFISRIISKGDIRVRGLYHKSAHLYADYKNDIAFMYSKRIPLHSKNLFNKLSSYLQTKREEYINSMRDSRLLKKQDGLSEFFRNISNIEKGTGEINDIYDDKS